MSKRVITGLTHSKKFRDLVVGLGILITVVLIYWMHDRFASVFFDSNFFGMFFTGKP